MTKKFQELRDKQQTCKPHRIPGTIAENEVWKKVQEIFSSPNMALNLIEEVKKLHGVLSQPKVTTF